MNEEWQIRLSLIAIVISLISMILMFINLNTLANIASGR